MGSINVKLLARLWCTCKCHQTWHQLNQEKNDLDETWMIDIWQAHFDAKFFMLKVTQNDLDETWMIDIWQAHFNAKFFMLEVTQILTPFLDCAHKFGSKKAHYMLVMMFDPPYLRTSL